MSKNNVGERERRIKHNYCASDSSEEDLQLAKQNLKHMGIFV